MALKTKGGHTPKAGPKKRAATEAERIREAIEEHGTRKVTSRRSSVRSFHYKEPKEKPKAKRVLSLDRPALGLSDHNARELHSWEETIIFVDASVVLDTLTRFQMVCDHKPLKVERPVATLAEVEYRQCSHCQVILRWWGSYTATLQAEWQSYRITSYSMEEWGELFTRDTSLWPFLIEEAHADKEDADDS